MRTMTNSVMNDPSDLLEIPILTDRDYAELLTERCVERFMRKLFLSDTRVRTLVMISPFIGMLEGTPFHMGWLAKKIEQERIITFIITQQPHEDYHRLAVEELMKCDHAEIRFNSLLHAKLFVAMSQDPHKAFAMFGSANLTKSGVERNIELGMMIYGRGKGREIINELYTWGAIRLRIHRESKLVKRLNSFGR